MKVGPVRFVNYIRERAIEELKLKNEEPENANAILNLSTTTNNYIELASHEIAIDCAEDFLLMLVAEELNLVMCCLIVSKISYWKVFGTRLPRMASESNKEAITTLR